MVALVSTVTLAASALDAKLVKSSVDEMQNILKVKKEQLDSMRQNAAVKNLEEMRQSKASAEQSTLMEMKMGEEAVTAVKMKVRMEQREDKVQSCKEEGEDAEAKPKKSKITLVDEKPKPQKSKITLVDEKPKPKWSENTQRSKLVLVGTSQSQSGVLTPKSSKESPWQEVQPKWVPSQRNQWPSQSSKSP